MVRLSLMICLNLLKCRLLNKLDQIGHAYINFSVYNTLSIYRDLEETCIDWRTRFEELEERLETSQVVQYSQYSTVQYSTVQYSTVQYSTVKYSSVQHSTLQFKTVQYSKIL